MTGRPGKLPNVKTAIAEALASGRYQFQQHCKIRMRERGIFEVEVLYVLRHGRHEPRKDKFSEEFQAWRYAMRGKTLDLTKELRVVASFDATAGLLLITAIDLGQGDAS
jgi:hypothetical protein